MRKVSLVILSLVVAATTAFAASNEVYSVNSVGYSTVTVPPTAFVMLGVSFDGFDPTYSGLIGEQLRSTGVQATSDQIFSWDPAANGGLGGYNNYFQYAGVYYLLPSFAVTNPPLVAGEALWIKAPDSGTFSTTTNEITILGEVVDVSTQLTQVVTGFQQLALPFSSDITLGELGLVDDGNWTGVQATSDAFYIWDPTANGGLGGYSSYLAYLGVVYLLPSFTVATDEVLPIGQGFWYEAKSGFTWTETNMYLNNL